MTKKPATMFGPAKYRNLSEMVSLRNPSAARGSVRELRKAFDSAATKDKKLRIARATQLAANRAAASANRGNLSAGERKQYREIAGIYGRAATAMFRRY